MQTIVLDGSHWTNMVEFSNDLVKALKPLGGHGSSVDAFIDSMIYGGMLEIEPPYQVVIQNVVCPEVRRGIQELSSALAEARKERQQNYGVDVEVSLQLVSS
jgi:RNAse (barnase) inhibitor barstar